MSGRDLLANPVVQRAIIRAKALALTNSVRELSLQLMLAGFYRLIVDGDEEALKILDGKQASLSVAVGRMQLSETLDLEAAAQSRLTVSDALRPILARSYDSVCDLVDALIEGLGPEDIQNNALFMEVVARASSAGRSLGLSEIGPELFAVAAYHAYLAGEFRDRPALSVHMATNRENFESLMQAKQWSSATFALADDRALVLSAAFLKSLDEGRNNRLLTGINLGAAAGMALHQRRVVAIHEAGHAVLWCVLRPHSPVTQVSIVPSADSEGRLSYDPTAPYLKLPSSRKHLLEDTCVCLAGNLAQQIAFGADAMDEGASSDIARAMHNVWAWVAQLGLDEEFGPICLPALAEASGSHAGWIHDRAQRRVQQILKECADRTRSVLQENWHHVQAVADGLVERGTLGAEELLALMIDKGLTDWPGVRHVRSVLVRREVKFASESGVHSTLEGPVQYNVGDAIVTGAVGESWPIGRATFESTYEPEPPLTMGEDGWYRKRVREALALQLTESRNVVLSNARGVLSGKAGDWIVDHGHGDLAVVADEVFLKYYEFIF